MSVIISNLPSYTGSASDLRWFVMNNSGETETFKFSGYSSQLIPGTGTGETYRTPTATASGADSIAIGDGASHDTGTDGIAIGKNASATSNRSTAIGGSTVTGGAATALGWGCTAAGLASAALGYFNNTPNQYALAVGSSNSVYADFSTAIGGNNYMVGGTFNITLGWDISLSSGSYNMALGGKTNTFTSTGSYNSIFNGSGNTLGGSFSAVTMLSTMGRTASADNTTYTENHASFGQSYQGYFDNGSGSTFTIDWNNGNTQKMSFTGAGGITCNNTQTGAHYRMVINNPNGYTPTSFTAAGRTIKFNGGSFVVYSGESICELFITNDSVFVNQLGLFS